MKHSPMHTKYEEGDAFNARLDFATFLEEARKHTSEARGAALTAVRQSTDAAEKQGSSLDDKKKKKSWKRSLFFWKKSEKKIKPENEIPPQAQESLNTNIPKQPRRSALSGPIHGGGGRIGTINRSSSSRRPASGPLAGALFAPSRRNEFEVPYMCLEQQNSNNPVRCEAFGPIYLVT